MSPEVGFDFEPEPWIERAACRSVAQQRGDHDLFFEVSHRLEGRDLCFRCPVAHECLDYAQRLNIPFGMWGGLDADQRRHTENQYGPVSHARGRAGHTLALNELRSRANRNRNRKRRRDRR